MDYLFSAIIGFGIIAYILAYFAAQQKSEGFRIYFFSLTMIMLMGILVLLLTAPDIKVRTDFTINQSITNYTAANQTEYYSLTEGTKGVVEGLFIVLLITFLLMTLVIFIVFILQIIMAFGGKKFGVKL